MATAMMASTTGPTSSAPVATASGYIALLQEPDAALRKHALTKLLGCVDTLWHEVAESLPDLETIAEDLDLPLEMRQTAAAVASRVFFSFRRTFASTPTCFRGWRSSFRLADEVALR